LQSKKDRQNLKSGFITGVTDAEDQEVISESLVFAESV
jgi:hypothetical protein